MALQTTVNKQLAAGMEGEFYDNSPRRVTTYVGRATDDANVKIGIAFTSTDTEGQAQAGGDGVFLGIAVSPKEYATYSNFNATLELPDGIAVQLCTFGHIYVRVAGDVEIGNAAYYNTETGVIIGDDSGTDLSTDGYVEIKNSSFKSAAASGEIAKLELGN